MSEGRLPDSPADSTSRQTAEKVARVFFQPGTDQASIEQGVRRWLMGAVWSAIIVPPIFYLQYGRVGPVGWGLTVFFSAYCLLSAIGLHFLVRTDYHTPITLRNDWLDYVGAFWLVACAFGPFLGWALTSAFTLTADDWRWLYLGRVILCIVLPVLTALPLLRYVRGRGAPLMLALLFSVTALPVWSGWATARDLLSEPVTVTNENAVSPSRSTEYWVLPHTRKVVKKP